MQKLWDIIKQDMNKDYSYLFNNDKICSFQFEPKHDANWWIKYRKRQQIEGWSTFIFLVLLGIMFYLLQIYGNKVHIFFVH